MSFGILGGCGVECKVNEVAVQFKVSPRIKKSIKAMALERDETVRSLILKALQDAGLQVADQELGDRRKATER